MAPYTDTKHAVEGISQCLRKELLPFGIDVVIIGPGQVQTPIWDKGSLDQYKETRYFHSMMKFFKYLVHKGKNGMTLDEFSRRVIPNLSIPPNATKNQPIKTIESILILISRDFNAT